MTLDEAVNYYHTLLKFGIMPGLERISVLCEKLGSPQKKLKFIHVAGTNGKGSTCTALACVLTKAGYKTGLYTSPYVIDFRERIQLNMNMISPEKLISVTQKVSSVVDKLQNEGIPITEFEAITAAAFLYFADENCDFVVLETGLGGRFDATNVIENPLCSIITSVSLDHVSILGDTLSKIAFEKCGIIKENCPVITGAEQNSDVLEVVKDVANKKNSRLILSDRKNIFFPISESITGTLVKSDNLEINIPWCGYHQLDNMSLVLEAVNVLREKGFSVRDKAIEDGISSARIPARTEIISSSPLVILDGSHNDSSTKALCDVIKKHLKDKKILAVMGMMADKDCKKSLSNLMPCFFEVITVKPSNPRSMSPEDLSQIARNLGVKSVSCDLPEDGIQLAFSKISDFDALIVCGSLYLAGDVRNLLLEIFRK